MLEFLYTLPDTCKILYHYYANPFTQWVIFSIRICIGQLHIKQKMSKVMKKMLASTVQNMVSVSELHENVF